MKAEILNLPPGTPPERVAAAMAAVTQLLADEQANAVTTRRDEGKPPWIRAALLESVSGGDLRWRPGPWTWGPLG